MVVAEQLDQSGAGVGYAEHAPDQSALLLHVPGLLPGERATARVLHQSPHRKEAWAELLRRDNAAPERVVPACAAYGRCGGCTLQHLDYPAQLAYKEQRLLAALAPLGIRPAAAVPSPSALGYRRRVKLVAARVKAAPDGAPGSGRLILGAYAPRSHTVIDMAGCQVMTRGLRQVARTLAAAAERLGFSVYDEGSGHGVLRYVLLREVASLAVQVSLVVADPAPEAQLSALTEILRAAHPQIASIVLHRNARRGNVLLDAATEELDDPEEPAEPAEEAAGSAAETALWSMEDSSGSQPGPESAAASESAAAGASADRLLWGSGHLWEEVGLLRVRVSARSFLQVNPEVAARLYKDAAAQLGLRSGDRILDLYCGVGGLGLTALAAAPSAHLLGVESSRSAIADARESARAAGLTHAEFVCAQAEAALPDRMDVALLNPPRRGCTEPVLQALCNAGPRSLAYMSCSPDSLARDLAQLLRHGYEVARVTPYDMHPGTPHVESLTVLQRR